MRYFAIALLPVAMFATNAIVMSHLMASDLVLPPDVVQDGGQWLEVAGRYRFLAATWLFLSFTVLALALLVRNLARPTALETRVAALVTIAFILLLVIVPTLQKDAMPDGPRVYHYLGAGVFEGALSQGTLPGCDAPDDQWLLGRCGDIPVISLFLRILDIVNIFAGLGVGALAVGMILCLQSRDDEDPEQQAALLAENLRQMRQQLYLSSLTLTFGMFFVTSWMYWPAAMVSDAEQSAYDSVVTSAALYTGTYFSLLILSFFLPVALVLDDRVRTLAEQASESEGTDERVDAEDWREAHGLKEGAMDYLRDGIALVAPILAAFAGGISPIGL